jgi:hypothetical protein
MMPKPDRDTEPLIVGSRNQKMPESVQANERQETKTKCGNETSHGKVA